VLIPSAMISHLNLPIGDNETRYSLVQYTPAALFRWVDNGGMTDKLWKNAVGDSSEAKEEREKERQARWARGLAMLSTLDELLN